MTVASPCTNVCQIDPRSGWCLGCARTIEEIAAWTTLTEADQRTVLARVAQRKASATTAKRP